MSDFKNTINSLTKSLTKTSNELIKTTKLNLSISSEEERLKSIYIELGKKVHEVYLYGGTLGKFFDEKYSELQQCEQKINELRLQLNKAKGNKPCINCGQQMDKNSEFCPKCGMKVSINSTIEDPKIKIEKEHVTAEQKITCSICSFENNLNSKFCQSCGRQLTLR